MSDAAPGPPMRLRCEYLLNPLGIDEPHPRLFWQVNDPRRCVLQSAYRVLVASGSAALDEDRGDVWDTGKVESGRNIHIEYDGPCLEARRRYYWKVRTWDDEERPSPWSEVAWWEMGLPAPDDWSAEWIGMPSDETPAPPAYLRRAFTVAGPVRRARVYVTALGVYELYLNGRQVGDDVFPPGWTLYRHRVMYRAHDVTDLLCAGGNALGAIVGNGWYCGPLGWKLECNLFGDPPPRFLAQLEVEYESGDVERIVTDGSWKCARGPILSSEFYAGESYDARREMPGWDGPDFADEAWRAVTVFKDTGAERSAQMDPPIRVSEELKPVSVTRREPGVFIFDMGQNMVGYCRLRASGPAGTEVRLRHAEVLDPDGALYTENLRKAAATDTYVLAGKGEQVRRPHFTYHGFRYVEVSGYPGEPTLDDLTGLVLHTDCEPAGTFETSSEMVNQLYRNVVWGQRGNMHSVLTDCPQRDERLGWTGDAQIFTRTACFNMDMAAMLAKFCRDITDSQSPDGAFTDVAPYVSPGGVVPPAGAPGWMDAGVIIPWLVYLCYGDTRILRRHVDSMERYIDFVTANNPSGIWENARGNDYGDWVPAGVQTDKTAFATLHYFYSAVLTAAAAQVLGRERLADKCAAVARRVRAAFNERYLKDGRYENATQTLNAMALEFGICPEEARAGVAADLAADVEGRDCHLSTGFSGAQCLLPALSEADRDDLAHHLLLNRDQPSWGYMIAKGATTIWERWNSDTEGPSMNSRNHFAYGAVAEWLFRCLAGIDTAVEGAGYGKIIFRPHPGPAGGELNRVSASYESIRGTVASRWRAVGDGLEMEVDVPANTRAVVYVPAYCAGDVTEGGLPLEQAEGIAAFREEDGCVVCEIGSGRYRFAVRGG